MKKIFYSQRMLVHTFAVMLTILIIQTAFFGDVILATALVEQLALEHSDAKIDMLVQKSREVLLDNNPHLRNVYRLDKTKKYTSILALIKIIRKNQYDVVLNVHRHGTSGILTFLSAAKLTIGFDTHPMSFLFHRRIKHQREGLHEIERNYKLGEHLFTKPVCHPRLYPSQDDFDLVKHERPYITISPASVWKTKKWPANDWVELINQFPNTIDVFLLGGPGDVLLCESIRDASRRPVNCMAGIYSFLASAALMSKAIMNYTNDSAPVHMASAMNAPVTTMFLSTIPAFGYGPLSDEQSIVECSEALSCRPCGIHGYQKCPEGHFKCAMIDAKLVFDLSMKDKNI